MTIDSKLIDWVPPQNDGYDEEAGRLVDTYEGLRDIGAVDFPSEYWIEPSDWKEEAAKATANKTFANDFRSHFTHQGASHECTCHALSQVFEVAYNQQRLLQVDANGVVNAAVNSQQKFFKHTLNRTAGTSDPDRGGGRWVSVGNFPDGWKDTAKHFKPLKVINPRSYEEMVCLIIRGFACGVGRSGHAIPYCEIVWDDGQLYAKYSDSYNTYRYDSVRMMRSAVGGAYSIVSTTVPDDWSRPAGEEMREPYLCKCPVWFSPLSVYAEANPRQWGGATMQGTLRIAMQRGMLPEHNGPELLNGRKNESKHYQNFD